MKFGDLKKGDCFSYQGDTMIKTCRIKAGNDARDIKTFHESLEEERDGENER